MKSLLICDCDEVLLHMVRHFGTWLGETHDIDFTANGGDFSTAMKRRDGSPPPTREEMWGMLNQFFPAEMHRQTLVPHAAEALKRIAEVADIVILTNLADECRQPRIDQLAAFGIEHRVECNTGGKGGPVARLVAEHGDPVTVFVDDLGVHHESVSPPRARRAPPADDLGAGDGTERAQGRTRTCPYRRLARRSRLDHRALCRRGHRN